MAVCGKEYSMYLGIDGNLDDGKNYFEAHTTAELAAKLDRNFVVDIEAHTHDTAIRYAAEMKTWRPSAPAVWRVVVLGPRLERRCRIDNSDVSLWATQIHAIPPSDVNYHKTPPVSDAESAQDEDAALPTAALAL